MMDLPTSACVALTKCITYLLLQLMISTKVKVFQMFKISIALTVAKQVLDYN